MPLNPSESPSERCLDLGFVLHFLCLLKGQWELESGTVTGHEGTLHSLVPKPQHMFFSVITVSIHSSCSLCVIFEVFLLSLQKTLRCIK